MHAFASQATPTLRDPSKSNADAGRERAPLAVGHKPAIAYRPEIDGLRALAVLPVILFHMGYGWLAGGYIGVDVFFVISGYLITSIVIKELEHGRLSFRDFWARRIRRILPALLTVSATTLAVTWLFVFKGEHPAIGRQSLAALLSVANIYFWQSTGDYWGPKAEDSPLLHTWSLSVEEQFYLVFPVAVWLIARRGFQWLRYAMLFVVGASFAVFLYGTIYHQTATFYLLPTRAWELGTGCLLAISVPAGTERGFGNRNSSLFALAGLGMIVASYLLLPNLNGGLALAVIGTGLVISFAHTGASYAILTGKPLVSVGKMSYSLYLWHWPVIVFAERAGVLSQRMAVFAVIVLLSIASYHLVERPTRRRSGVIPLIATGYLVMMCLSCRLAFASALYDTSAFEPTTSYMFYYDLKPSSRRNAEQFQAENVNISTPVRDFALDGFRSGGIRIGKDDSDPQVVVLGDSHGVMWSDAIRTVTEKLGVNAAFYSMNAVDPFVTLPLRPSADLKNLSSEEKYEYDSSRLKFIKQWKPRVVIVCACWSRYTDKDAEDLLRFLEEHAGCVLLMEQPPELTIGNSNALQYLCYQQVVPEPGVRRYLPEGGIEKSRKARELVRELAGRFRNCRYLATFDLFSHDAEVLVLDGKRAVYMDDDHLTAHGASLGIPRIERMLSEVLIDAADTRE